MEGGISNTGDVIIQQKSAYTIIEFPATVYRNCEDCYIRGSKLQTFVYPNN